LKTLARLTCCALLIVLAACSNPEITKKKYFDQGNTAFDKGQFTEAILAYRNAIKVDPLYGDARWKLAQTYEKVNQPANAMREYVRAADLMPARADAQLMAAKYLIVAQQYEDARTRAKRALDLDPKSAEAHIVLGTAIAGTKDLNGAMKEVEDAIALAPNSARLYTNKAALQLAQGDKAEAKTTFEQAVKLEPKSIDVRLALANFYWSTGAITNAEATIKAALEIDPKNAKANRAMAVLYDATDRSAAAEPYMKATAAAAGTPEAQLALARYYLRLNRPDAAKPILEQLTNSKLAADAKVQLAQIDYSAGDHGRAYARLDEVLAKTPADSNALVTKAKFLLADNRVKDALGPAETATRANPDSALAHLVLAQAQARAGDVEKAKASYGEVLRLAPRSTVAQTALAALNLQSGNADTAVQLARDAAKAEPETVLQPRLVLVRSLLAQQHVDEASSEMAALLRHAPDNPAVRSLNGTLLLLKKDPTGARREFEGALTKDPGNLDALNGLANLDAQAGQLPRSRDRVSARLAADPRNPGLLLLAARIDLQGGDAAAGEAKLRTIVEVAPANMEAYSLLGRLYVQQKKLDEARREFETLAALQTKPVGARTAIGLILTIQNKPDEAIKAYQQALSLDPSAPVAANNTAYLYAERGENLDQALALARAAASRAPDEPQITDTVGWVYYKKQQPALAVPQFEKSVAKAPDNPVFQYHLGLGYAGAGEPDKARRALEEALRLNPSFDGAAQARQTLASLKD
jgi:putative PEP-CTERM system TPR-repeat lipoprotein